MKNIHELTENGISETIVEILEKRERDGDKKKRKKGRDRFVVIEELAQQFICSYTSNGHVTRIL